MKKIVSLMMGILLIIICFNFVGCEKKKCTQPEEKSPVEIKSGITQTNGNTKFYSKFFGDTVTVKIRDQHYTPLEGINVIYLATEDAMMILAYDTSSQYLPGVFTHAGTDAFISHYKRASNAGSSIIIVLAPTAGTYITFETNPLSIASQLSIMSAIRSNFSQSISTVTVQSTLQDMWQLLPYKTGGIRINYEEAMVLGEIAISEPITQEIKSLLLQKVINEFLNKGVQLNITQT